MESGLTQLQIDDLARQGVDVTGLSVGYPPTDDMRIRLGIQGDVDPGALPDPVSTAQVAEGMATTLDPQAEALNAGSMDPAAVAGAMNAVPPAAPVTQDQLTAPKSGGLISGIGDMLFGPQENQEGDQFSSLNRQQRMMLAFGAIKDAGFALQGKEGTAFSSTLKAINDQIDIGRKAKAAQAQRDALASVMGTSGAVGGDIQAQIEQLSRLAVANPSLAPGIAVRIKALQDQLMATEAEVGKVTTATDQLDLIQRMKDKVNKLTTGPIGMFAALAPFSDAAALRNMAVTLESNLAFSTLVDLKAQGGTLGAVSEAELNLLKAEIAKFDANMQPEEVIRQLETVDREYRRIIRRAFDTSPDPDALAQSIGGRPAWLNGSTTPAEPLSDEDLDNLYPPTTN